MNSIARWFILSAVVPFAMSCTPKLHQGHFTRHGEFEEGYDFWENGHFRWQKRDQGTVTVGEGVYNHVAQRELKLSFGPYLRKLHLANFQNAPTVGRTSIELHAIYSNGVPIEGLILVVEGDTLATTNQQGYASVLLKNEKVIYHLEFQLAGYRTDKFGIQGGDTSFNLAYEADVNAVVKENHTVFIKYSGWGNTFFITQDGVRRRYWAPRNFKYWINAY